MRNLAIGDHVKGAGYFGRIKEIHGNGLVTVLWEDGGEGEFYDTQLKLVYKSNRFNFVIFKNYDGTVTGKRIPREAYRRLTGSV